MKLKNELKDNLFGRKLDRERRRTGNEGQLSQFEKDNIELQKRSQGIHSKLIIDL